MIGFQVLKDQNLGLNSKKVPILPGRKYHISTEAAGIFGEKFSAYFSIIMFDDEGKEILRRIKWLNDFSGSPVKYSITAKAPDNARSALMAYRVNTESAIESDWSGSLTDINNLEPIPVDDSYAEDFDTTVIVRVSNNQRLEVNSKEFSILPGEKYNACIEAAGISGEKFSAYFSIIMLDETGKEILRRIRWLNDFSGSPVKYSITAKAPDNARSALMAYRINTESALESDWSGSLTDISNLEPVSAYDTDIEDFDTVVIIRVRRDQNLEMNTEKFPVSPGKKYCMSIATTGIQGEKYSAYFSIIFHDAIGKEIIRRIRWLNDFSNKAVEYTLITQAPKYAATAVLAYRINAEGTLRSNCILKIKDINSIPLTETESEETYDELDDYLRSDDATFKIEFSPLSQEEEGILEHRMVWIFGSPRTGSSWLAKQLLAYPTHTVWDEPLLGMHLGMVVPKKDMKLGKKIFSRLIEDVSDSTQYFFLPLYEKAWLPYLRSMILNRCYAQFPDSLNKTVIIKEPTGSYGSDIIMRSLPKSRMIFILRDPRDVIDSQIDMHREDSWVSESWRKTFRPITPERRKTMIAYYSYQWLSLIETIFEAYQNHDPSLRILIRYEDLRLNTFEELFKIYQFIGTSIIDIEINNIIKKFSFENIPKEEKGSGKFTRRAKPGGWRETFSDKEKEIMNTILGDKLREFGYET